MKPAPLFYGPALLLAMCGGCGSEVPLPDRAPVQGRVTLNGQPLTQGTVTFVPDTSRGTEGPIATGTIQPDGTYELSTAREAGDGAVVGFHCVRVQAVVGEPGAPGSLLVPPHYQNEQRSGLTAEVRAGQTNQVDLPLESPSGPR